MTHKNGLRLVVYRQGSTFRVFAQGEKTFLLVPEEDWVTLADAHFFPTRKLVEAREAIEDMRASKELLAKLQEESLLHG